MSRSVNIRFQEFGGLSNEIRQELAVFLMHITDISSIYDQYFDIVTPAEKNKKKKPKKKAFGTSVSHGTKNAL